ncbi:4Fe-4S dicluster domain-containing protein [Halocola ammonii]
MISSIIFILVMAVGIALFAMRIRQIRKNILLGRDLELSGSKSERWKTMARVALGQSKMVTRPIAGIMHILIYVGFIIINIEVLEIIIDGIFGTHRIFAFIGPVYDVLIASFEFLAVGVILSCVIFLARRYIVRLKRFFAREMTSWPKLDATIILVVEILLMFAFLSMNATDYLLQQKLAAAQASGGEISEQLSHYIQAGSFPVSEALLVPIYEGMDTSALIFTERFMWWFHIVGILAFLVYIPYSKHFHIFLAFPNTYYSKLTPKGQFSNMESVTNEVKLMMDPDADPYAAPAEPEGDEAPGPFGAKDVQDLNWKQLMDSYSCTECGRCTSVCPANITGKLLSPRKIMMDTRDRLEEVGKNVQKDGSIKDDGKSLLYDHISEEELWACTTCNACVDACPVNIDPLGIIVDLRRFLIMEESKSPEAITAMFNNVENNGAPWAFPATDRDKWRQDV